MKVKRDTEKRLQDDISKFIYDPYGFAMYAYPWGVPGTILEDETGPDPWQKMIMDDLAHAMKHGWVMNNGVKKDCAAGIFIAVRSGHGIGKSALFSMLDQWFMSTQPHPQIVTTANTKEQLTSKTWREQAKWHKLLVNKHWFRWQATKFHCIIDETTWASRAIPWSERNPEAFAGTHERAVLVKFDEASSIPDIIWETTEGAMTDSKGIKIWIVFGNPTLPTGRFSECFKKFRSMWLTYEVDSRTSKRTDHKLIAKWAEIYGEDSDFFRVRVKGQEPRTGALQFIGNEIAEEARGRIIHPSLYYHRPKILGLDIARFGDDQTVFIHRQGLAAYGLLKFRNLGHKQIAGQAAEILDKGETHMLFLDMGMDGASVYETLVSWGYGDIVTGVDFGSTSETPTFYNKRAEMWGKMKEWLANGGCYPDDSELRDDLIGPTYDFAGRKEQILLEPKKLMKARGLASPDCGDALALTFAYPVALKSDIRHQARAPQQVAVMEEENLFTRPPTTPKRVKPRAGGLTYLDLTRGGFDE